MNRIFRIIILLTSLNFYIVGVTAQDNSLLESIEMEEARIVADILNNGIGDRLIVTGVTVSGKLPSKITISSESNGLLKLTNELPNDEVPIDFIYGGGISYMGNESIHRFNGRVKFKDGKLWGPLFEGTGNIENRLTFLLLKDIGYVYVRGQGKVYNPDGSYLEM